MKTATRTKIPKTTVLKNKDTGKVVKLKQSDSKYPVKNKRYA